MLTAKCTQRRSDGQPLRALRGALFRAAIREVITTEDTKSTTIDLLSRPPLPHLSDQRFAGVGEGEGLRSPLRSSRLLPTTTYQLPTTAFAPAASPLPTPLRRAPSSRDQPASLPAAEVGASKPQPPRGLTPSERSRPHPLRFAPWRETTCTQRNDSRSFLCVLSVLCVSLPRLCPFTRDERSRLRLSVQRDGNSASLRLSGARGASPCR